MKLLIHVIPNKCEESCHGVRRYLALLEIGELERLQMTGWAWISGSTRKWEIESEKFT